jgi:cytochrome c peroxidase
VLGLDAQLRQNFGNWGIVPIGNMPAQNPAMVELGRALFFDKILSGNKDVACASCHQPSAALGDGQGLAVGTGARIIGSTRLPGAGRTFVVRQSPTLLNSGLGLFYMFWDGRLTRFGQTFGPGPIGGPTPGAPLPPQGGNALALQPKFSVLDRREMRGEIGENELADVPDTQPTAVYQAVMKRLTAIPEYVDMFRAAFPTKSTSALTFDDAALAIATFQMQAFTKTNTPFDRYLNRDDAALTTDQKRGALLFFGKAQCSSCHNGPFLGAQNFTNIGVPQIGPGVARRMPLDLGRGELEPNNSFYQFAFRVAPLRNVELTAPYMHNGAYATLEAVVNHYANVPRALREYDASQLSAELRSLYHGDGATVDAVLATLDQRLRTPMDLTDAEKAELVSFLKALTDPAARNLSSITPARVPSGLTLN